MPTKTSTTTQITLRLPTEAVRHLDEMVAQGNGKSRAAIVAKALRRMDRRTRAEQDALVIAAGEPDTDMNALADWAGQHADWTDLD